MAGKNIINISTVANSDNRGNFISGFISAFDICGGRNEIPDFTRGFERDTEALRGDWRRIGGDIRRAMDLVGNEQ
jgi:hypothetical protein